MSAGDLVAGNYAPFLLLDYPAAARKIGGASAFRCASRSKGLAVSQDGRVFRMRLGGHGYNDKFVLEGGECVLSYVCGTMEEQRRQNLNRPGDAVLVNLRDERDRHAILGGVFRRIEASPDKKPDGTELLTARSYIAIVAYDTHAGLVQLATADAAAAPPKRARRPPCEHLVFDTESAAPLDRRLLGRRHAPFPALELAYYRVGHDFRRVLKMHSALLAYDASLGERLGNDEQSAVLKFPLCELQAGDPAGCALDGLLAEIERVVASGGFVFAHNARHDVEQVRAALQLLGRSSPGVRVRAIDTVKTAGNFVAGVETWTKLADLARLAGLPAAGAVNGRLHYAADDALLLLNVLRASFPPEQLDAFAEEYTI